MERYSSSSFENDENGFLVRYDDVEAELATLRARLAEVERERDALRGIKPELPPRPPNVVPGVRYGIRWNGPTEPLAVPMADGYWTPWHVADAAVAAERERCESLKIALREIARPKRGGIDASSTDAESAEYWSAACERERQTAREVLAALESGAPAPREG